MRDWMLRGYKDAQDCTPYDRAPAHGRGKYGGPDVPQSHLTADWQAYMDGWKAGVKDAGIKARAKQLFR